ncbi:MAG: 3',5'-cyclic-nucleotide phosphodiesterase [Burkholderiaceae bacterium]|nr:3',5'-cyclic-nucleotide phosphodiesterase [Burkholderiaceae bacterium]
MKVRVLGCSGAIVRGCMTTAFLVDDDLLIDAGTGVGSLTDEEMLRIDDVFLTHAHLDHIAWLPLMVDSVACARAGRSPLRVHALAETIAALRRHIFNDAIWPDFSRLPSAAAPLLTFHPLHTGEQRRAGSRIVEALPAQHSVPAVGYALRRASPAGAPWWVFSGDTGRNPAFWSRVNQLDTAALVIETTFSGSQQELAHRSGHLFPAALADELDHIAPARRYPIYISHAKPTQTEALMREIAQFGQGRRDPPHDIRWLAAGHVFEL